MFDDKTAKYSFVILSTLIRLISARLNFAISWIFAIFAKLNLEKTFCVGHSQNYIHLGFSLNQDCLFCSFFFYFGDIISCDRKCYFLIVIKFESNLSIKKVWKCISKFTMVFFFVKLFHSRNIIHSKFFKLLIREI